MVWQLVSLSAHSHIAIGLQNRFWWEIQQMLVTRAYETLININ